MADPSWSSFAGLTTVDGTAVPAADGKTILGDASVAGYDGIVFFAAKNGQPYTGQLKICVIQVPAIGPYFIGSTDNEDEELAEALSDSGTGFRYESRSITGDAEGYFHFDFKTDFKDVDWWSRDDDGVNRSIYGDADGDGIANGNDYYWAIPKSKIAAISGINVCFSSGFEVGDTVSIGDMRIYKDSRIHVDELDEYMAMYDSLDPEAYTEESYENATEKYLVAYEIFNDPDIAEKYDQAAIDDAADALKKALRDLLPMFRSKSDKCTLKGFDVLTEDDIDEINDGNYSYDAAMLTDDPLPNDEVNQSVCVIGGAFDGPPSYGWSCFSTAKYDEEESPVVVKNVFDPEGAIEETAGIRFWIKYAESYIPRPVSMVVGLGDTTNGVYFECDEASVQVPSDEGYIGVAWNTFYDIEGDADIFEHLSTLDYFVLKVCDCEQMEFYISDLHAFDWSLQSANFTNMDKTIVDAQDYMASIDKSKFTVKSWQRLESSIAAARELHNTYGVTQEEADAAAATITNNISRLTPIGNSATQEEVNALESAYRSAKDYWRGNYQAASYARLKEVIDTVSKYIDDEMSSADCQKYTKQITDATANLKPLGYTSLVTSILSFENMTTRQFSKADGDRRDNIGYSLDNKFAGLPNGYAKGLKMLAQQDCSSSTTDEHGAMQFKLMYRAKGSGTVMSIADDIENPNIPGDMIGACIGDLTGTSGLRMWVGVNDVNLTENCTLRIGVSNCTEGPLFERHSTEIPFPSTGNGWILIPWEYFEYYDEWTKGVEINLKEIRFYIIRVDGVIKQGLELYVTGISAYKDPVPTVNAVPAITNITNGQEIDVAGGEFRPNWDVGSATINGEYFVYGNSLTRNGEYTMKVTNGDKSTEVNFTIVGGQTAFELPVVAGVENGKTYQDPITITWDVGEAVLNGNPVEKGITVSEAGTYVLEVTNGDKLVTVKFVIESAEVYDTPVVTGVEDGGEYEGEVTVGWDVGTATLNGESFEAGKITTAGTYVLVVTNGDKTVTVNFTVKEKQTPPAGTKGDFDGDGAITVADALAALRIGAKLVEETPEAIAIGDTDNDGHVTVADALAILRVAAKLADHL